MIMKTADSCYVLSAFGHIYEQKEYFTLMGQKFTVIVNDTLEDIQHAILQPYIGDWEKRYRYDHFGYKK